MSHPMIKTACVVAGFAVAALAATSAHAAKPLTIQQKIAMGEAMARAHQTKASSKSKTSAKTSAKTMQFSMPAGGAGAEVPEDLQNYLTVQHNADGTLHILESDGHAMPVLNAPEASNEK